MFIEGFNDLRSCPAKERGAVFVGLAVVLEGCDVWRAAYAMCLVKACGQDCAGVLAAVVVGCGLAAMLLSLLALALA